MALNHITTRCSPEEIFSHLVDCAEYPKWLLGASKIRRIEAEWPAVGSCFHHTIGHGPLRFRDRSEVIAVDPPHRLELHVRVTPLVQGRVTFTVRPCGDGALLTLQEEPAARLIGNLVRPVLDPVTHLRNHRSLHQLAALMDETHDRTPVA